MNDNAWILEVLKDIEHFANKDGLTHLADKCREAQTTARRELTISLPVAERG